VDGSLHKAMDNHLLTLGCVIVNVIYIWNRMQEDMIWQM